MSDTPAPLQNPVSPFTPMTTPAMERANHLLSVKANPGFNDLVRIGQDLVKEATDVCSDYPGWDPQQIMVLQARQKASKEFHQEWLRRINVAIDEGVVEAQTLSATLPSKTAEEAIDQGDYVRQKVLERFTEEDQRPAGSY